MKRSRIFENLAERAYKRPLGAASEAAPDPRLVTGPSLKDPIPTKSPIPTSSEKPNERSNVAIPCTRITTSTALLDVAHTLVWTKCVPYGGSHGGMRSLAPSETLASTLAVNDELRAARPGDTPLLEPTIRRPRLVLLNATGTQHPESSRDQWTDAEHGEFRVDDPDSAYFDAWRLMGVVHSTEGEMDADSDEPAKEVAVLTHVDGPVTLINDFCERPLVGDFLYVGMTRTGTNDRDGSSVHELFYFSSQHTDMPDFQPKQARQANASTGSGLLLKSGRKRRPHGWNARRRTELRAMRGRVWRIGRIVDSNLMDDRMTVLFCMRELSLDEFWRCHHADAPPSADAPHADAADDAIAAFVRFAERIEDGGVDGGVERAYATLAEQSNASSTDDAFAVLGNVLCPVPEAFDERLKQLLRASGTSIRDATHMIDMAYDRIVALLRPPPMDVANFFANDADYSKIVAVVFKAAELAISALHRALVTGRTGDGRLPSASVLNALRHAVEFCTTILDVALMQRHLKVHDALTSAFEQGGDELVGVVSMEDDDTVDFDKIVRDACGNISKQTSGGKADGPRIQRVYNVFLALLLTGVTFRTMRRSLQTL